MFLIVQSAVIKSGALAGDAGIFVTTDKLVYGPGDKIGLNINVDSGEESLSGNLIISVYPPASPRAPERLSGEPVSQAVIDQEFRVSGQNGLLYETDVAKLSAGTGGFPVKISLVGEQGEMLSGTTWLAVVEPGARGPIDLVLLWTAGSPPERGPQGVFETIRLLERCRDEPRTPDSLLQHHEMAARYPNIRTTYAFEGSLLDQISDMSDGFALAAENGDIPGAGEDAPLEAAQLAASCLESLRDLAETGNAEIIATPYQFASLPLLAREGWADGSGQYRIGHDVLTSALALPAVPKGAYVPNLDLTTDSLRYVAATGGEYAVLAGSIRQSVAGRIQPGELLFRLRDLGGERITAIFADDDASAVLLGEAPDPNAFFAVLANAYRSTESPLVVAASPVSNPALTADDRARVYAELSLQPWIQTLTLGQAKNKYRPGTEPVTLQRYVDPLEEGYITRTYYQELARVHELFEAYRVAVDTDEPKLLELVKNMYTAESGYFLRPNASPEEANLGLAYLEHVNSFVEGELAGIEVKVKTPWLQRNAEGEALVTIQNGNHYPFNMRLVLAGEAVEFPGEGSQDIRLQPGSMEIRVPYRSEGWSGITASLESRGNSLVADSAGIRPVTSRVWIVLIAGLLATAGGASYYLFVMRRR
ncbi:MAG: hypothetical protein IBX61_02470 [Thermoleophilia bacterium]|nr:hypothetical protein [Thermoleophilia bacterium]